MKKGVRVTNNQRRDLNRFVTPEMRQQIVRLRRELGDCEGRLSGHFHVINKVQEALTIAQECAQCLLTNDPFGAWEKLTRQKEIEDDIFESEDDDPRPSVKEDKEATPLDEAKGNVTKLVTPEMRQQIVELKGQLESYAACLRKAFDDMLKLESLNNAVELANAVKCVDQLESWEARKKREQLVKDEEECLGDL